MRRVCSVFEHLRLLDRLSGTERITIRVIDNRTNPRVAHLFR